MGIASAIENSIDTMLQTYVSDTIADVCSALTPIALTSLSIYFIVMGWAIMRGDAQDPFHTFVWKTFRIALIVGLALQAGTFNTYIHEAITGLNNALVQTISGAPSVGQLIDNVAEPFVVLVAKIMEESADDFFPDFTLLIVAALIYIAQAFITIVGLGIYLMAKVALSLTIVFGPIAIFLSLFDATRKFTESWIGAVINYAVLTALVGATLSMLTKIAIQAADRVQSTYDSGTENLLADAAGLILICIALAVVMLNINTLATALAGGASLSGIGRDIGRYATGKIRKTKDEQERDGKTVGAAARAIANRFRNRENTVEKTDGRRGSGNAADKSPKQQPAHRRHTLEHLRKSA